MHADDMAAHEDADAPTADSAIDSCDTSDKSSPDTSTSAALSAPGRWDTKLSLCCCLVLAQGVARGLLVLWYFIYKRLELLEAASSLALARRKQKKTPTYQDVRPRHCPRRHHRPHAVRSRTRHPPIHRLVQRRLPAHRRAHPRNHRRWQHTRHPHLSRREPGLRSRSLVPPSLHRFCHCFESQWHERSFRQRSASVGSERGYLQQSGDVCHGPGSAVECGHGECFLSGTLPSF